MTPLEAALFTTRAASRRASCAFFESLEAIAWRAILIALFTAVRTVKFRARRFWACRFRFSAERMLAKVVLGADGLMR